MNPELTPAAVYSPATTKIVLPAGLSAGQLAALTKANPTVGFLAIDETAAQPAAGYHREAIQPIVDIVTNVAMGAITFVPPPWGLLAGLVVKLGGPIVMNMLDKDPVKERWTIEDLDAMAESVQLPKT